MALKICQVSKVFFFSVANSLYSKASTYVGVIWTINIFICVYWKFTATMF